VSSGHLDGLRASVSSGFTSAQFHAASSILIAPDDPTPVKHEARKAAHAWQIRSRSWMLKLKFHQCASMWVNLICYRTSAAKHPSCCIRWHYPLRVITSKQELLEGLKYRRTGVDHPHSSRLGFLTSGVCNAHVTVSTFAPFIRLIFDDVPPSR